MNKENQKLNDDKRQRPPRRVPKGMRDYDGASDKLGLGRTTLWKLVKTGKLRALRPGGGTAGPGSRVLFRDVDLDVYLNRVANRKTA